MRLAEEYGLEFLETSAMSSVNVEQAFVGLARQVKKRLESEGGSNSNNTTSSGVKLNNQGGAGSYASCCYGGGATKKKN